MTKLDGEGDAASPVILPTDFAARMAARLGVRFIVEVADIGRRGAPFLDALLIAAVVEANVGRLNRDPALQARHARLDSPPPDDLRRPVSINALAVSLNQPFETVRRHINQLIAAGVCVSTPSGVYVPTKALVSPEFIETARARYELFWTFHAELRRLGVVEPVDFVVPPADHPEAPVRAVGRILSDYFFRTIEVLHRHVRDPLTGVVLLTIVRANTDHISPAQVEALMRGDWLRDEHRAAVRVAELARRMGVPYETLRRHVGWLVDQGYCKRVAGGVIITAELLARPTVAGISLENFANVRRMFRQAAQLGPAGRCAAEHASTLGG